MKAIVNTKIITLNGIIWDGAITFEGDRLLQVDWADNVQIPEDAEIIDAGGLYAAPGLIDIHNHGGPKYRFQEDPMHSAEFFLPHGMTTILPTYYSDMTLEQLIAGMNAVKEAAKTKLGRVLDGLYMEGPYMNPTLGANQKYTRWSGPILEEEYKPLVDAMKGYTRIWAIDPARPGIEAFMRYVKEADPGAIFANGHSHGTFADCRKVQKYGVKVQTHFNDSGQAPGFAQGTAGSGCDHFTLHEPDMYAELICDEVGVHVDGDLIKTLVRTKGVERVILITDHGAPKGDFKNNEEEGILYGPDLNYDYEGHLAGSKMTLDNGVRNLMKHTAYGLAHAIRMASYNPACLLGIDDQVGSLEPGKKANIILIDDMVNVKSVFLEGDHVAQDGKLI